MSSVELLRRLERSALIALAVLTLAAFLGRPAEPRFALGIAGGGVLAAISYWGILGLIPGHSRAFALVKFFTRHAILALAAYVMMARLKLHPVGMLVGVSVPILAAAVEAVRSRTK